MRDILNMAFEVQEKPGFCTTYTLQVALYALDQVSTNPKNVRWWRK
jgi:hypothetical protein